MQCHVKGRGHSLIGGTNFQKLGDINQVTDNINSSLRGSQLRKRSSKLISTV